MDKQKVAIYIDGQNFYQGLIDNFFNEFQCTRNIKMNDIQQGFDLLGFCQYLARGQDLAAVYYFDARLTDRLFRGVAIANQGRFLKGLEKKFGIKVELGQVQGTKDYKYQKGVDVRMATYLIRDAHRNVYNMAYLLSSDKDFCPAIEYIQSFSKKRVINYVFFKNRHTKMLADMCRRMRKLENRDIYVFCSDKLLGTLRHLTTLKNSTWYLERKHKGVKGYLIADKKKSLRVGML